MDILARAEALIDLHRPEEALALTRDAHELDPEAPAPHLVAAQAHLAADRPKAAREAARIALRLDPTSEHAARLIALSHSAAGEAKEARHWASEAVRLTPASATSHALLAQLESLDGARMALERAEGAVGLAPDDPFTHVSLGIVLLNDRRYVAAEQALRHALSLDPEDTDALSMLGQTLAARGRPRDAAELLQLAARSDIRDEVIHQDMLRYVRGAAWGLATWPIITVVAVAFLVSALEGHDGAERMVVTAGWASLLVVLVAARIQRLRQFPREVQRLLNRRSVRRDAFEMQGAFAAGVWLSGDERSDDNIINGVGWALAATALTVWWMQQRRKARAPSALYEAPPA